MAIKRPIALYDGILKVLQQGDTTPDTSIAALAHSEAKNASETASVAISIAERGSGVLKYYGSQVGSDGANNNTTFTLPETFTVGDSGLFVYVNGQKATISVSATTTTEYEETNSNTVTFGDSLQDTDKVEFYIFSIINGDPYIVASKATSIAKVASEIASEAVSLAHLLVGSYAASEARSIAIAVESQAVLDNSIADRANSFAMVADSMADRNESIAVVISEAELKTYTIANSTAGQPRDGKVVYMTSTNNTVGLAKANSENTMPAFGIIVNDDGTSVQVKSLTTLYNKVKVDSSANIVAGANIFVSVLEAGKITNVVPETTGHVVQNIGIADEAQSSANIDLQFRAGMAITL